MALITPERLAEERQRHKRMGPIGPHKLDSYGMSGWRWAVKVESFAKRIRATTMLDYGAGKGTLSKKLANVSNYDPVTFPGNPDPADLVVCTDVLEFVEDLDAVLTHIKMLARKGVFIAVPKHPKEKKHKGLRIERLNWWEDLLAGYWPIYEARVVVFDDYGVHPWEGEGTPRLQFTAQC